MRWGKSGWISNAATSLPQFLCSTAPVVTMALHIHPTILSDLTIKQAFDSDTGISHVSLSGNPTFTFRYWITTRYILLKFTWDHIKAWYDVLSFTPFSSEAAWTRLHPEQSIINTISVRINETNPPTFPSQASLMSTYLAPTTPPAHTSPPNQTVYPTTALIALMQKSLQQNATMTTQLNSCPSPHPTQPQPLSYQFKPDPPPLTKWDSTPPTTPLFLAHIETYKSEAFYARVHDWTQKTPTNRQLSVAIFSEMLASLLSLI